MRQACRTRGRLQQEAGPGWPVQQVLLLESPMTCSPPCALGTLAAIDYRTWGELPSVLMCSRLVFS